MARTIVQILSRRAQNDSPSCGRLLLKQFVTRTQIGRLTVPDDASADKERQPAFESLLKIFRGLPSLLSVFEHIRFELIGEAAAAFYGSTALVDKLEILMLSRSDYNESVYFLRSNGFTGGRVSCKGNSSSVHFWEYEWFFKDKSGDTFRLNVLVPISITACECALNDFGEGLNELETLRGVRFCSVNFLFVLKSLTQRPADVADMVEVIQGGSEIDWNRIRSVSSHLVCDRYVFNCLSDLNLIYDAFYSDGEL